jgi:uncharacterized protein YjbJ (UPF0337 family)
LLGILDNPIFSFGVEGSVGFVLSGRASGFLFLCTRTGTEAVPNYNKHRTQPRRWKMDKDRVKGTVDDVAGRAKRQVGEWTGDTRTQAEGAAQQVKGKAEKAWGNVKDAARESNKEANKESEHKPAGARK